MCPGSLPQCRTVCFILCVTMCVIVHWYRGDGTHVPVCNVCMCNCTPPGVVSCVISLCVVRYGWLSVRPQSCLCVWICTCMFAFVCLVVRPCICLCVCPITTSTTHAMICGCIHSGMICCLPARLPIKCTHACGDVRVVVCILGWPHQNYCCAWAVVILECVTTPCHT